MVVHTVGHTKYVNRWLNVLLPRVQPLLYGNGGPVIMVQVRYNDAGCKVPTNK